MKTLKICNIKDFTEKLFIGETFDNFLLTECTITTSIRISIDGRIVTSEENDYITWKQVKSIAKEGVKGSKLPQSFKIVLKLSPENTDKTISSINMQLDDRPGLFINIYYENECLIVTSGTYTVAFLSGNELEGAWSDIVIRFLNKNKINFEEL